MNELDEKQTITESAVADLAPRAICLEADVSAMKSKTGGAEAADASSPIVQFHLKIPEARCDDAERRSRRSKLLLFGLEDKSLETWAGSDQFVRDTCFQILAQRSTILSLIGP